MFVNFSGNLDKRQYNYAGVGGICLKQNFQSTFWMLWLSDNILTNFNIEY